jgi:hypothetical protein
VLHTVKGERKILHTIKGNKSEWIGNNSRRNSILKYITEEKIEGTGIRGTRLKQLLDDLEEKEGCWKLGKKQ